MNLNITQIIGITNCQIDKKKKFKNSINFIITMFSKLLNKWD